MERGRLVAELVGDMDDDLVADGGADNGRRPVAVDADDGAHLQSIWAVLDPGDVEVIGDGGGGGGRGYCQEEKNYEQHQHRFSTDCCMLHDEAQSLKGMEREVALFVSFMMRN